MESRDISDMTTNLCISQLVNNNLEFVFPLARKRSSANARTTSLYALMLKFSVRGLSEAL